MTDDDDSEADPLEDHPHQYGAHDPKFQFHLEMARFNQACHQNRQIYEWKMAFGIWTAVGVFTYFVLEKRTEIQLSAFGLFVVYAILFLLWYFVWYVPMITATERDRHYRNSHLDAIAQMYPIAPDPNAARRIFSWNWFTPVFTAAILLGSWFVIWQAQTGRAP